MDIVRLSDVMRRCRSGLAATEPAAIEAALDAVEAGVGGFSGTSLGPGELGSEWESMIGLYRAVRGSDASMQARHVASDVEEQLIRIYYALRSVQGSLTMTYALRGGEIERPRSSPVGSAIGLYDSPKVLAQEMHLASGSYDSMLPTFAEWMQEIWTDMRIREAQYRHFYGDDDIREARSMLERVLDIEPNGTPLPRHIGSGESEEPGRLRQQLARRAADATDLIGAARVIESTAQEARLTLISILAHKDAYRSQYSDEQIAQAEADLEAAIHWPFPVGKTAIYDLQGEQDALDELFGAIADEPQGVRAHRAEWSPKVAAALQRACSIEQSLRDHREAYASQYHDQRMRRSFRWYIWALLDLVEQSAPTQGLGARPIQGLATASELGDSL